MDLPKRYNKNMSHATQEFTRARCGKCCHQPIPWCEEDIRRVKAAGLLGDTEFEPYVGTTMLLGKTFIETKYKTNPSAACSFYGDDGKCRIYALRPTLCKLYSSNDLNARFLRYGCQKFNLFCLGYQGI